jgi:hypothetical protein
MCNNITKIETMDVFMTEDQHYRKKYRNALVEIKLLIEPYTNKPEIKELCREINEVTKRCGI